MKHASTSFLVGIDLGTTHTVVAYAEPGKKNRSTIEIFDIPQLVAPGQVSGRPLLPSVRYHPAPGELAEADTVLPWSQITSPEYAVLGEWARALGAKAYGRFVTSAKSWLSHAGVDRTAPILPWGAPEDVIKVSPVEASTSYLAHVRCAWNSHFPRQPLEQQDIVVTVPASFDEASRALTLEAARQAGLHRVKLIEEPQAACYDWLWRNRKSLARQLAEVRLLLVVDVGGGTTDLTLIQVESGENEPMLTRIGVGNHLMLGGDNIDLTLAHLAESRLAEGDRRLSAGELAQLLEHCRNAKEQLLSDEPPDTVPVTLLGAGSRMIGGTRTVNLSLEEVRRIVLDGFFPITQSDDLPERKRSAVVEFGLPYAADPAISKHVAAFINQHRQVIQEAMGPDRTPFPDALLLNGGVFNSPVIVQRVLDLLAAWRSSPPRILKNDHPDQAVAYGAVAYGLARQGLGTQKIGGGSARSYFLQVDTGDTGIPLGVCLLPRGTEEDQEIILQERKFALRLGQPVRFHLASSVEDTSYQPGDLVPLDERFVKLPPLAVALEQENGNPSQEVTVQLVANLTELGTLRLQCGAVDKQTQRWDVEFQLRQTHSTPRAFNQTARHPRCAEAKNLITTIFGKKSREIDSKQIRGLRIELEKLLGKKETWDSTLLRDLFSALLEGLPHRRRSAEHERTWLNLTGYCLRPGFGHPLDDWRVEQIWQIYEQGIQYIHEAQNWAEWWTLWRRIAGGLNEDAQSRLFNSLAWYINPESARKGNLLTVAKKRAYEDMVRLAAVLERIPVDAKVELGQWLLQRLGKPGEPAENGWALGRVGARIPFYGSLHTLVPQEIVERWLAHILELDWKKTEFSAFAVTLMARMSGHRQRDINPTQRLQILDRLRENRVPDTWIRMVTEVCELNETDEKKFFGEALPPGLKLLF